MRRRVIILIIILLLLSLIRVGKGVAIITKINNVSNEANVQYMQKDVTVHLKRNTLYEIGDEFPVYYIKLQVPFIKNIYYVWGGEYFDSYNQRENLSYYQKRLRK